MDDGRIELPTTGLNRSARWLEAHGAIEQYPLIVHMNGAIGDFDSTGHEEGGRVAIDHVDAEIGLIPMTETIRDLESNLPCPTQIECFDDAHLLTDGCSLHLHHPGFVMEGPDRGEP